MTDEEYKISILIRDAVFDNGDKTSVIGHYAHKAREIVEEVRADERSKTIDEIKRLVKQLSNSGYRDIDGDWVESSCNTDDLLDFLEKMKGGEENEQN